MDSEILHETLQQQEELGGKIETIVKNYKKDGTDRKSVTYYQKRLKQLNELIREFIKNDELLQEVEDKDKDSEYFTSNYATIIKSLAEQYVEIFSRSIKTLSAQNSQGAAPKSDKSTTGNDNNDNQQIIKLIRRQNAMISSLTRLIQVTVPEDATAPSLKAKEKLWEQIQEIHFTISEMSEEPAANGYDIDAYMDLEVKLMQNFAAATHANHCVENNFSSSSSNVPLPKINIPKFNGEYEKWPTFFDLFTKVIHDQKISPVQKMWYLKTNLTGEAERLIRHLALTDSNYDTAWKILKDRFNNKRILTASIIQRMVEHENLTSETTAIKNFHDIIQENLAALKNLGVNTNHWDPLLLHILVKKLDRHTHNLYETSISNPTELQTIDNFLKFLQHRFQALELMRNKENSKQKSTLPKESNKVTSAATTSDQCKVCNEKGHPIYYCNKFKDMTPSERLKWTQSKRLCVNCFKSDHKAKLCQHGSCKKCNKKHNTLLHLVTEKNSQQSNTASAIAQVTSAASQEIPLELPPVAVSTASSKSHAKTTQSYVLLATAKIKIIANNGQSCEARAVLDAGSQINLITRRIVNRLSLSTSRSQLTIEGIGQRNEQSKERVNVSLQAQNGAFSTRFEAYVLPQIIPPQPSRNLDISTWPIPSKVKLADPDFYKSEKIDVLIGAEFYHHLLNGEQIHLGENLPLLQNTKLGWIVIGKTQTNKSTSATCAVLTESDQNLANILQKFWKLEEINDDQKIMTTTEIQCEKHFYNTISKDEGGRFVVRLPFSNKPTVLGESKYRAERRLEALECRFKHDPQLKEDYKKFMNEYEALGHMQIIKKKDIPVVNYFIPHHCVRKPESSTTKLRVVFDAAAKTSSGLSLNDILLKGPTVQSELVSILLRFRTHRFVFTADIEKMYRQIRMHQDDTAQQLIVWRKDPTEDFQYYRLKTVTYGTTSAPYLATKCLQHLATENLNMFALGAPVVRDDFYVDDCLSGANDLTTALEIQKQVITLLGKAGFKLRKWCANHSALLVGIPAEDKEINFNLADISEQTIKTLGLIWLPGADKLCGRASSGVCGKLTKRSVLSELARIFDPLGIFAPITVRAKIFMQQLWDRKLTWDEELPIQLKQEWTQFQHNLNNVNKLQIDRHIFNKKIPKNIQIHTFADASEHAYGAAVYIRATYTDNTITNRLLCAKSKVAPLKKLTIPRLELCAAVMGAELTERIRIDLNYANVPTFFWSDSTIVLSWIHSPNSALYNFVANRVGRIQRTSNSDQWHHVSSKNNPADVLSRGVDPDKLNAESMWFHGPLFLYGNKEWWLEPDVKVQELPNDIERRATRVSAITCSSNELATLIKNIEHKNSFITLQNIIGYLRRPFRRPKPTQLVLLPSELRDALLTIVKAIQVTEFEKEIGHLKKYGTVAASSKLSALAPFLDDQEVLRVGGRLESSSLPYDAKHPMLLPYNDPIVKLLFKFKHEEYGHCGSQTLLSIMRQNFWPIKGKLTSRNIVHNCVQCSKAKPALMQQIMGHLPADRVTMSRPFLKTGVDYCGPFWIHYKIRGKKPTKAYLAVFCCFATKAVHLELVTELTTNAFLGALNRFVGRRGCCQVIYSDNASNFLGAKNKLDELSESIFAKSSQDIITRACGKKGIEFKFIPPRAPHFGGLWEAAVKSAKYLLVRSASTASLTYEELETVIIGIEAILNSRPLTPISSDPNDFTAITPGHFLIGEPLTALPDANASHTKLSLVTRWELVSRIKYDFWNRWSKEYLHELQQRNKWKKTSNNLKEGDMVVIKEDNLPIMKWPLGRVQRVYRGEDGFVRVADIKTATGMSKRPIHRLALLPIENNDDIPDTTDTAEEIQTEEGSLRVSIPLSRIRKADLSNTPEIPKKTSRKHLGLFITLLTLLLLPTVFCASIIQRKFPNTPGIYFEGIGTVNRITGDWKVITYFDLNPIVAQMEMFKNGTTTLQELCPRLHQEDMCLQLVNKFKRINIEVRSEDKLMRRRVTRGALNFVGNIANKLFGVLDSDYAEDLSKTINQLNSNEDLLYKMIQNQTSVIDSTINIVTKETKTIEVKLNNLQQEIDNITMETIHVANHIDLLEVYTSITSQLSLMATDLERIEEAIFNILTDARHGKISPLLISPQQLQSEIIKIKGHLPKSLHFPFDQEDAIHLYSLMSSQSGISSHHVVFVITLPLTDNESFDLFHLIPIPAAINNSMLHIQPDTSYFAITSHLEHYFAMTHEELQDCFQINEGRNQLLCADKQSKYHQGAEEYSCELDMLKNKTNTNCILMEQKSEISRTPLDHSNYWIVGSKRSTHLTVVCNGVTELLELQGSYLFNLTEDCTLRHHTFTIRAHQTFKDAIYKSYASFGDWTLINASTDILKLYPSPLDLKGELQQLKELHEDIRLRDVPQRIKIQSIHHHAISYSALFLVLGTIMWLLWKLRKPRTKDSVNRSTHAPAPARRFSVDPEVVV